MNNINNINISENNKIYNKLTYKIGDKFLARIVNLNLQNDEALLQLTNGWKFPAKIKSQNEMLPKSLCQFEITGYENGNIKIKMLSPQNNENLAVSQIQNDILIKNGFEKGDFRLLYSMINNDIHLTEYNLEMIKKMFHFKDISQDEVKCKNFITKFLNSKGILQNSKQAESITNSLNNWFNSLKSLTQDDILFLYKNNIDMTSKNIKSFLKFRDEDSVLYKEFKLIDNEILQQPVRDEDSALYKEFKAMDNESLQQAVRDEDSVLYKEFKPMDNESLKQAVRDEDSALYKEFKAMDNESLQQALRDEDSALYKEFKPMDNESLKQAVRDEDSVLYKEFKLIDNESLQQTVKNDDNIINNLNLEEIYLKVRKDIQQKNDYIKSVIKCILKDSQNYNNKFEKNISKLLNQYTNDMKIYNTISNQYYYLDLPININQNSYECKLLIKEDRKLHKKIDTKNVKIVVSINTIHMGTIDVFFKVNNDIMDIDIQTDKKFIDILNNNKNKLKDILNGSKYNILINVNEKKKKVSLSTCAEFFCDKNVKCIDVVI